VRYGHATEGCRHQLRIAALGRIRVLTISARRVLTISARQANLSKRDDDHRQVPNQQCCAKKHNRHADKDH
jgi:hypothetical protein